MQVSENIFRAYDIRGVYDKEITEETAKEIGKAFGTYIGVGKNLTVGRDVRPTGQNLQAALTNGLLSTGCHVTDIGIVPTPVFYFAIVHYGKDGGVIVTASHNPAGWNGFKLCREKGILCSEGMGMEQIKEITLSRRFKSAPHGRIGKYDKTLEDYIDFVLDKVAVKRRLKVAVDLGNGSCSVIVPDLYRKAGMEVVAIHAEPDGASPDYKPEPTEKTLERLKEITVEKKADFGAGYDGDGDRAIFIDNKGRVIPSDFTLLILARHYAEKEEGPIVYDLSCSCRVQEVIEALQRKPVMSRVGRAYIMDAMMREGAVLGGETSGHLYFADMYGFDDAIYAGLKMGEILSGTSKKLSEMLDDIPKYPTTPIKVYKCPDQKKFKIVEHLAKKFREKGYKTVTIDGVKVIDSDGWLLIRASNTLPQIKMKAEAKTQKRLSELVSMGEKEITRSMSM